MVNVQMRRVRWNDRRLRCFGRSACEFDTFDVLVALEMDDLRVVPRFSPLHAR